jgi:serine/threonine-protein kinase
MAKANPGAELAPTARRAHVLALLVLLGVLAALWSLFLWTELVASRRGGPAFCALGSDGCAALWDGGFAGAVQEVTRLPIAGWGMVWGLAASFLPLASLAGVGGARTRGHFDSAAVVIGGAGAAGVVLMLAASAAAKLFCASCAVFYALALAYAVAAFRGMMAGEARLTDRGLAFAAATTVALYLLLLYPGTRTPASVARASERALAATVGGGAATGSGRGAAASPSSTATGAEAAGVAGADRLLADLIANLEPEGRQALADSLHLYRSSQQVEPRPPRALRGAPGAPVRITEFSDVLCGHCAALHRTLDYLETVLPAGSFSVDSRNFPLDGNCNRHLAVRGPESVRCVAARARICLDPTPGGRQFTGSLFARQDELTPGLVAELASAHLPADELARCTASAGTAQELVADLDYAWRFEPDGTPLVLVNGRRGTSYGPFLYAMVLTGGDPGHAAFAALPPANPHAHIH